MKQTVKTSRTTGYLEKIYRKLNARFFDNELPEVIITVQSTPRAYGHLTVSEVWRSGQEMKHEINIGAGTLDRPIENTCATLTHEMVHLYNLIHEIKDTSRGGTYHNKRFKAEAEKRGLIIQYDKRIGWSITEPGDELLNFVLEEGLTDIDMGRKEYLSLRGIGGTSSTGNGGKLPKRPSSTRKYICPCCGMSVRATKVVNIKCGDCDETMITE